MAIVLSLALIIGTVLGLFGGGGGILTVPLLHYGLKLPVDEAIVTSLIVLSISSVFSTVQYARWGQVRWREGLLLGISGIIGSISGSLLTPLLPQQLLMMLLTTIMTASGIAMLCQRNKVLSCDNNDSDPVVLPFVAICGLAIGLLTGLVGAGGGFLVVPALLLLFRLPLRDAIGTSLFVIALNTSFGAFTHLGIHLPDIALLTTICLFAIFGTFMGSRLATLIAVQTLHKAFALFIMLVALGILLREIPTVSTQLWYLHHPWLWDMAAVLNIAGLVYFLTRSCLARSWRLPFFS